VIVAGLALPAAGAAQETYTFSVSLLAGAGGSLDEGGFGNTSYQLGFSALTERRTHLSVRLGALDFGAGELDTLSDASLNYINVAGEYRATEGFYESALYLGLGAYDLDARKLDGGSVGDTSIGLVLGVLGDFEINSDWVVRLEGAVHYADVERLRAHLTAQAGVAYRF
jgi:hypothetical protein